MFFLLLFSDPGITIEQGLFIARVSPGGVIAKDGIMLSAGDRIVKVSALIISFVHILTSEPFAFPPFVYLPSMSEINNTQ